MRMPRGCGAFCGKVVRRIRSLYDLQNALRSWRKHLVARMKGLEFEQRLADPCGFRLIEAGSVSVIAVVHVNGIFAVGRKNKCARFCEDSAKLVSISNVCEFRWYAGCHYSHDKVTGV